MTVIYLERTPALLLEEDWGRAEQKTLKSLYYLAERTNEIKGTTEKDGRQEVSMWNNDGSGNSKFATRNLKCGGLSL